LGGYFDEVKAAFFGQGQRLSRRNYSDLAPLLIDKTNFRDTYPPVHPGSFFYDIAIPPILSALTLGFERRVI